MDAADPPLHTLVAEKPGPSGDHLIMDIKGLD